MVTTRAAISKSVSLGKRAKKKAPAKKKRNYKVQKNKKR